MASMGIGHPKTVTNSAYLIDGFYFGRIFMHSNFRYLRFFWDCMHAKIACPWQAALYPAGRLITRQS